VLDSYEDEISYKRAHHDDGLIINATVFQENNQYEEEEDEEGEEEEEDEDSDAEPQFYNVRDLTVADLNSESLLEDEADEATDTGEKLDIIDSRRPTKDGSRGKLLCHMGFQYTQVGDKTVATKTWACNQYHKHKCTARCTTNTERVSSLRWVNEGHNHPPCEQNTVKEKVANKLKDLAAKTTHTEARATILESCKEVAKEFGPYVHTARQMQELVKYQQKKKGKHGPAPKSVEEIDIKPEQRVTNNKEDFVLYENKEQKIFMFGTQSNLDLLNNTSVWLADGTFSIAPDIFYQLYTINIIHGGQNLPMVYILFGNKTEASYNIAFAELKKRIPNDPANIVVDFEKAPINAFKRHFRRSRMRGCLFHLLQNWWKHVSKEGLAKFYKDAFALAFTFCKCLPFVDPLCVIPAFEFIKSMAPASFKPVLDYIEKYYIGLVNPNNKTQRAVPSFPIDLWTCYDRVLPVDPKAQIVPRTNNSIEAWHKGFVV
jgi:hypothetical protein